MEASPIEGPYRQVQILGEGCVAAQGGQHAPRPYGEAVAGTCLITKALRRWVRGVSSNSIVVLVQRACVLEGVRSQFDLAFWGIGDLRLAGSGRSLSPCCWCLWPTSKGTHMHPADAFVWSSCPSLAAGKWSVDGGLLDGLVIARSKERLGDSIIVPRHVQGL